MQIYCGKRCYFLFGCDELTLMRKPSDRGQLEAEAASCRAQVQHDKKVEIASAKNEREKKQGDTGWGGSQGVPPRTRVAVVPRKPRKRGRKWTLSRDARVGQPS